jgi:hypothetical protein
LLKVLLTFDTEVHAIHPDWKKDRLQRDIDRDIEGIVDGRRVGLDYELDVLAKNRLKAVFMVESLFSATPEVGEEPLKQVIRRIRSASHEIQLHLHCEWIEHGHSIGIPYRGKFQRLYSLEEQESLLRFGCARLAECGSAKPSAFRAGGFAADASTLQALANAGFTYDSSFNPGYPEKCYLPPPRSFGSACLSNGTWEVPIAAFHDYPGHLRPAQICACSARELIHALEQAEKLGWKQFVILAHSFEMLSGRWQGKPAIRKEVVDTFERVCAFLGENCDRFPTVGFGQLERPEDELAVSPAEIHGNMILTAGRMMQRAAARGRSKVGL